MCILDGFRVYFEKTPYLPYRVRGKKSKKMNCIFLQGTCKQFSLALSSTTTKKILCSCEMIEAKRYRRGTSPLQVSY